MVFKIFQLLLPNKIPLLVNRQNFNSPVDRKKHITAILPTDVSGSLFLFLCQFITYMSC